MNDPVAATIDIPQAASTLWDAVVVGAGPAGAFAALGLASAGLSTLLIERRSFPRHKPCGGSLNACAVGTLTDAGLLDTLVASGAQSFWAVRLRQSRHDVTLPMAKGLALSRATFDAVLVRAAIAAGSAFLPETAAKVVADPGAAFPDRSRLRAVTLRRKDAEEAVAKARVLIIADGLGHRSLDDCPEFQSTIARGARLGIGAIADGSTIACTAGTITMSVGTGGYVGVTGVEDGRVDIAAALDADFLKARVRPAAALRDILAGAGTQVGVDFGDIDFLGTIPLTRAMRRPVGYRLFVLGDAAGYIEPITGEGMEWALSAAGAVVPFVARAMSDWDRAIERDWLAAYSRVVSREQPWCRAIARTLRHPAVVGVLAAALEWQPALARPVLTHLATPTSGSGRRP